MSVLPTNVRTSGHANPAPQNSAMSLRLTSSDVTLGGQRHLASISSLDGTNINSASPPTGCL
jgi:hypothetical protein